MHLSILYFSCYFTGEYPKFDGIILLGEQGYRIPNQSHEVNSKEWAFKKVVYLRYLVHASVSYFLIIQNLVAIYILPDLPWAPPGREARKARAAASAAAAVPPAVSAVSVVCALSPRKCVFARFLGAMSQEPHTRQLHASLEHVECCNFSFAFSGIVFDSCREEKTHPLKKVIVLWFLFHFFLWNQTIHVQVLRPNNATCFCFCTTKTTSLASLLLKTIDFLD